MAAYARQAVVRTNSGFTISGQAVSLVPTVSFPAASTGSVVATHWGLGTLVSGAGVLMFKGTITPNITITNGVTPQLNAGQFLTESGAGNAFVTNLLQLLFNQTTLTNLATSSGITSLYLSLHSADPGVTGDQTTSELSYS